MSQLEDAFAKQFEEDGTMDWIRQQAGLADDADAEDTTETPADEADTEDVEEVDEPDESDEAEADEEEDEPDDTEDTSQEDEEDGDGLYLELTPETQAFLDKYDGDLNKALQGAANLSTRFGSQGNELGTLRQELQQLRAEIQAGITRPQLEWPDADDEPEDAVRAYRQIADAAFESQNAEVFGQAMTAWQEIDPMGSETWATMKATQVMLAQAQDVAGHPGGVTLEDGIEQLKEQYPLSDPAFQEEVGKELERFPTLRATFQDQTAAPTERLAALEEAARLVASRQADGDVRQAVRRVAVRTSEEGRERRAKARVASGGSRGKQTTPEDRQIQVGDTGQTVGENELKQRIKELTGMDVEVGGSTFRTRK